MRNNQDMYGHLRIFLNRKQKLSDLANVSVRLSVRQKFVYTIIDDRIKIIECGFYTHFQIWKKRYTKCGYKRMTYEK